MTRELVLNLTEDQASILVAALDEYRDRWLNADGTDSDDSATAERLRRETLDKLPRAWTDSGGLVF